MKANVFANVRKARFGSVLLAAFCITVLAASPAKANTTITGPCPVVINQPGEYALNGNLTCAPNVDGIDIQASNVTLLLRGHVIEGNCGSTAYGIHVQGTLTTPLTGVRILGGGTISNFTYNFWADYSSNSFVNGVKVTSQCVGNYGFTINSNSSQWALIKDTVQAPESSYGMLLFGTANVAALCNVNDTISVGYNNILVNNIASNNSGGIFVYGSGNQIYSNTTNSNTGGQGIWVLSGALGNVLSENKASSNLNWDMEDDNSNCGTNFWLGDTFGSANQSCIR